MTCGSCCANSTHVSRNRPRRSSTAAPLRSTPESGGRAGYDGHKRKKGSKLHLAADTPGHLLALTVTPANEDDRQQVQALAQQVLVFTSLMLAN